MVETSFPILEAPLNVEQWKSVARGFGTGVLDEGGNPYNLTSLSNVNNTAVIAVDTKTRFNHAVVSGFYHKMDAPITVELPAVARATTYRVALVYSPLEKEMPVKLAVVTSLDTTGGKEYLVLWEVTRQPNQLLTDAARVKKRPTIAPTIMVDTRESLPEIGTVMWGTRAFVQKTNIEMRASYNGWHPISPHIVGLISPAGWEMQSPTGGIQVVPAEGGLFCTATLRPVRLAYSYNMGEKYHSIGVAIPDGYRPTMNVYALANQDNAVHEAYIGPSGELNVRSRNGTFNLVTGRSFTATFSWFVPKTY